jgi:hypothetical protein
VPLEYKISLSLAKTIQALACLILLRNKPMQVPSVAQLIPLLQTAIGPVILISGVGLLLLTMTNRLGRVIDRARLLSRESSVALETRDARIPAQLQVLWRRARLIRLAIALASMSALAAAILVIVLFLTALWQTEAAWLIISMFIVCMLCLIGSLVVFIHDVNQSLAALKIELAAEDKLDA